MASEFGFYIVSNWLVFLAGLVVLREHLQAVFGTTFGSSSKLGQSNSLAGAPQRLMISRDTEILLWVSQWARIYWCCSPPELWSHDPSNLQIICLADLILSLALWTAIVVLGAKNRQPYRQGKAEVEKFYGRQLIPTWATWQALFAMAAFVISPLARNFINEEHENIVNPNNPPFPFADYAIMLNMSLDTFAIVPQMYLISRVDEELCSK